MKRIRLIHWNAVEASGKAVILQSAGYAVDHRIPRGPELLRELRESPPAAVVIDLSRLPAQGRDLGVLLRYAKSTRSVPLVYVDGEPAKVEQIKGLLPDAAYTTWENIGTALNRAIAHPPRSPIAPKSVFDAYAGTPLATKLGIKPKSIVALLGAPRGFAKRIGELPEGASLRRRIGRGCDLVLWFNTSRSTLKLTIDDMVTVLGEGKLWIAWPKRGANVATDLMQQEVREIGLHAGLVDFKICSIDETWSALLFTRRKEK